jgi:mono/diheme cytochrome c family protein
VLSAGALWLCVAGEPRADGTGWFTLDQVAAGRVEYGAKCATCHGSQLQGTGAPALRGRSFSLLWNRKTLGEFYTYVHKQMPLGSPDSLKLQEYADIVAFILAQNGLPAGVDRLTPATPMNRAHAWPAARRSCPSGRPPRSSYSS